MKVTPIPFPSSRLFLLGCLLGGFFAAWWTITGESWEVLADGRQYLMMYQGEIAASPYGYRVLVPFLARLLPMSPQAGFAVVTISCLILTSGVIALYVTHSRSPWFTSITMCTLWGMSFPFVYLATTQIRAEAPTLLLMAVALLLSRRGASVWLLATLIAVGGLAHEMVLISIPALWLDKWTGGVLTGGARYRTRDLAILSLATAAFLLGVRGIVPTATGQISYATTSLLELVGRVLAYSGGPLKHALRIYAAFGPALLYAIIFLVWWGRRSDQLAFLGMGMLAVMATFLATDTLRVMELAYLPVIVWATRFLEVIWTNGRRVSVAILLALQASYSILVYGHLRTFEASRQLNVIAAVLSLLALGICLLAVALARSRAAQMRPSMETET